MDQLILHHNQQLALYALCMWKEEICALTGRRGVTEEKILLKRNKENVLCSWQEWKQKHLSSKLIGTLSKKISDRTLVSMLGIWFDHWKQTRETKKRVQIKIRMDTVRTVVTRIMFGHIFYAWKFLKQDMSRSDLCSPSNALVEVMSSNSMNLMKHTVCMWKKEVQNDLQIKNHCAKTIQSAVIVWIQRRRTQMRIKRLGENIPSMMSLIAQQHFTPKREIKFCDFRFVQGLQEGNLDFTRAKISPTNNASVRKGISYLKAGEMEEKRIGLLLTDVMHGWKFVCRKYHIKRYQEIALKYFTIRGLQQQVTCNPTRAFSNLWNSYFNRYLIQRYLLFWINHYEMTYGHTRSEMNRLFNKHIVKRAYRKHFWSWTSVVNRTKQQLKAYKLCANQCTLILLDSKFALWTKTVEENKPRVVNFLRSSHMTIRTRFFHNWRNFPYEQKSLFQKIRLVLRKYLFSWLKFTRDKLRPTAAEQFQQSSRCADLQHSLRELLRKFRLARLPQSVWLYLRCRGRLHHTKSSNFAEESQPDHQYPNSLVMYGRSRTRVVACVPSIENINTVWDVWFSNFQLFYMANLTSVSFQQQLLSSA